MATTIQALRFASRTCRRTIITSRSSSCSLRIQIQRALSSTPHRHDQDDKPSSQPKSSGARTETGGIEGRQQGNNSGLENVSNKLAALGSRSEDTVAEENKLDLGAEFGESEDDEQFVQRMRMGTNRSIKAQIKKFARNALYEPDEDDDEDGLIHDTEDDAKAMMKRKVKETFMNMGEDEMFDDDEKDETDEDDIGTLGHMELEQHREMRYYAKLAAWDMPLLSKMSKPFVPPRKDQPLRFRYTSYMGEHHPAEKKVVCEFCTADMPDLTDLQREKLRKLAGARYNPQTDIVKMSSEIYETQAQNKRYIGDLIDKLLMEARDPTDTFEDVPLDTRHHVFKTKSKFPKEWRMTPTRREELDAHRQALLEKDEQRSLEGAMIDGIKQIESVMAARAAEAAAMPEVVLSPKLGKGRKATIRR